MNEDIVNAVLRKERSNIRELLGRAEVDLGAAEGLIARAIIAWDAAGREPALIFFIDSRCREYARRRNRDYVGLKETREAIARARSARDGGR